MLFFTPMINVGFNFSVHSFPPLLKLFCQLTFCTHSATVVNPCSGSGLCSVVRQRSNCKYSQFSMFFLLFQPFPHGQKSNPPPQMWHGFFIMSFLFFFVASWENISLYTLVDTSLIYFHVDIKSKGAATLTDKPSVTRLVIYMRLWWNEFASFHCSRPLLGVLPSVESLSPACRSGFNSSVRWNSSLKVIKLTLLLWLPEYPRN